MRLQMNILAATEETTQRRPVLLQHDLIQQMSTIKLPRLDPIRYQFE